MKRMMQSVLMAVLILGCTVGLCLAAGGQGASDGTGPIHDVLGGEFFAVRGDVSTMLPGSGLVLATEADDMTIYGIGPESYWTTLGVARPGVGDTIGVTGFAVDYDSVVRNIAMTVTIGEITVDLRDPDTGLPLW